MHNARFFTSVVNVPWITVPRRVDVGIFTLHEARPLPATFVVRTAVEPTLTEHKYFRRAREDGEHAATNQEYDPQTIR